ncbi:TANK-binding kinase 1-binding protein 1-like [Oncorhynchus keta]|uniref:TANK-binding kinase 1-binding protein 1-like n=1 Tax=Oncorhynchus keta TaxID=8018 RepID=UPI0015FB3DFC|nr:TANK-binding kinase 1-binding protein 1-like [Oncorhynchus keta]XP_035603062.1 TANK-binding kinase 1-binding protein 1-like [Oncorhynchus keta]
MESLFGGELGLLGGGEGLRDDGCGLGSGVNWSSSPIQDDMYPSHFALAAAYHDIKTRLASLERENSSIKRKLKNYEVKFPMISEFEEERTLQCCSCEPKETSLLQSETTNLQQRVNSLTQELQKSKEREERLEDVIQAYEKIHMEKSNVQRDLDKMTTLAEQHMERICGLESALRQREGSLQKLSAQLHSKNIHYLQLHTSLDVPRERNGRGPTLQSSRSLDAVSDLKLQRLEAELEGARQQAQGACQREKEMKEELQRLQAEIRQLQQNVQRQEVTTPCEHCDMEWIKKAGDEQVNLALAYTELTEELVRVRGLAVKQTEILRKASHEQMVLRHSPAPQRRSPASQRPSPDRLHSSPPLSPSSPPSGPASYSPTGLSYSPNGPASYSCRPTSQRLRARFQGRRSYSEVADSSAHQRPPPRLLRDPVSTLPKPKNMGESGAYSRPPRISLVGLPRPASARGAVGAGGGGGGGASSLSSSPHHHALELGFPLAAEGRHFCHLKDPPAPTPQVTPPQSSDDEEWRCPSPVSSPPRTLGAMGVSPREPPPCPSFLALKDPAPLACHLPGYLNADHAQSWPSINLWMETEENDARSCPLCQLTFPTGYPDDALIKHIDTHLENSKI